jgi:ParB family chromosome partitioning protein
MKVPIEDIVIKDRVRTDLGDLKPLMDSLQNHGQLNPITLSRENELIAGHRRTLAAKELGWKYIEAHIVDRSSEAEKLQLELEENVHRKDFSPEELLAGYRRLDKLLRPTISRRIGRAIGNFFKRLFPWGSKRRKQKQAVNEQSDTKASSNEGLEGTSEIGTYGV